MKTLAIFPFKFGVRPSLFGLHIPDLKLTGHNFPYAFLLEVKFPSQDSLQI